MLKSLFSPLIKAMKKFSVLIGIILIMAVCATLFFFNPVAGGAASVISALGFANFGVGNFAGSKSGWGYLMKSNNPEDTYILTAAQMANLGVWVGFNNLDINGDRHELNIIEYDSADAPTMTDYANTPINTLMIAAKLTKPTLFIHKAQSDPAVIGDWFKIEGTVVS